VVYLNLIKNQKKRKTFFVVSYLINFGGLFNKYAIIASQSPRILFQSLERLDSMLNLLKENGFSDAQISQIVKIHQLVLLSDPKKTLLPKIELLCSVGVSSSDFSYNHTHFNGLPESHSSPPGWHCATPYGLGVAFWPPLTPSRWPEVRGGFPANPSILILILN
jgi:hypothetical protein